MRMVVFVIASLSSRAVFLDLAKHPGWQGSMARSTFIAIPFRVVGLTKKIIAMNAEPYYPGNFSSPLPGLPVAKASCKGGSEMNAKHLKSKVGGALLGISLLLSIGVVSTANAQGQWPWGQDRDYRRDRDRRDDRDNRRNRDDRDYRRNRDDRNGRGGYGGYGNYGYQVARDRGYQDGLQTGSSDASRRQNYEPQRSHYYRNATYGYDRSYGNKGQYKQVYRDGFVQGYNEGYRRYGGNRRNNGRSFPW